MKYFSIFLFCLVGCGTPNPCAHDAILATVIGTLLGFFVGFKIAERIYRNKS